MSDLSGAAEEIAVGKPDPPTNLRGAPTEPGELTLEWDSLPGVTKYRVYVADANGTPRVVDDTTSRACITWGYAPGSLQGFCVSAIVCVDGVEYVSDPSELVSVRAG